MKRPSAPRVSDDDAALFREAVGDAIPLRAPKRHAAAAPAAPPIPVQSLLDEHAALAASRSGRRNPDIEDEASFVQAGVSPQVLRRLRRGDWVVQDDLDLHGLARAAARTAVADFLRESLRHGRRCVRIVHGKGLGSKNREPVLRGKVRAWLAQRAEVLAFCQAPPTQGGSGAVLVLLGAAQPAAARGR
jgi:DNA-nicking Smr family endonuclease